MKMTTPGADIKRFLRMMEASLISAGPGQADGGVYNPQEEALEELRGGGYMAERAARHLLRVDIFRQTKIPVSVRVRVFTSTSHNPLLRSSASSVQRPGTAQSLNGCGCHGTSEEDVLIGQGAVCEGADVTEADKDKQEADVTEADKDKQEADVTEADKDKQEADVTEADEDKQEADVTGNVGGGTRIRKMFERGEWEEKIQGNKLICASCYFPNLGHRRRLQELHGLTQRPREDGRSIIPRGPRGSNTTPQNLMDPETDPVAVLGTFRGGRHERPKMKKNLANFRYRSLSQRSGRPRGRGVDESPAQGRGTGVELGQLTSDINSTHQNTGERSQHYVRTDTRQSLDLHLPPPIFMGAKETNEPKRRNNPRRT
ncbi:hypothetical protein D9C73_022333 [Collichthys lucidus]|uniref:Uncharacterized protein n=1 Tax=Collichthys lucidus TaxID=240159 RepID=A0A4U5VLN0_COLLU|nr:hypothetical protein D9C73_022333 [Collichthys lucidus]